MENIVQKLQSDFPQFTFELGERCTWSPSVRTIIYNSPRDPSDIWSLLHELGHALLDHKEYTSDIELLKKETAAWRKAQEVAQNYSVVVSRDFIENCLDTYRDWVYKRSQCPRCTLQGIQKAPEAYVCLNCKSTWLVTTARFCRPYRRPQIKQGSV